MIKNKMMTYNFLLTRFVNSCFIFVMITGCNVKGCNVKGCNVKKYTTKPVCAVVICDITSSLDSNIIKEEAKRAYNLYKELPAGSILTAFPVTSDIKTAPIFQGSIPIRETSTRLKKRQYDLEVSAQAQKFGDTLYFKYQIERKQKKNDQSCIINTLSLAHNFFRQQDSSKYRFELYYLSDMIEECDESEAGRMYLCSNSNPPNEKAYIEQVKEKYKPGFDLKSGLGNHIYIVTSENNTTGVKCLSAAKQKTIWKAVFQKIGYTENDVDSFSWGSYLPPRNN